SSAKLAIFQWPSNCTLLRRMRSQIQQSPFHSLIRFAGRGFLAGVLALSFLAYAGAARHGRQSNDQQSQPVRKSRRTAQTLSDTEISEARELLNQLGYWVDPDAKRNDASLRHALIAFQKIEGRNRTGVLNREELEALRVAREPQTLETGTRTSRSIYTGRSC